MHLYILFNINHFLKLYLQSSRAIRISEQTGTPESVSAPFLSTITAIAILFASYFCNWLTVSIMAVPVVITSSTTTQFLPTTFAKLWLNAPLAPSLFVSHCCLFGWNIANLSLIHISEPTRLGMISY